MSHMRQTKDLIGKHRIRMFVVVVLALLGGFFIGIVLSQIIGITGMLLFGRVIGIKFLPIPSAIICAVTVLIVLRRRAP